MSGTPAYYVLDVSCDNRMSLYDLPEPNRTQGDMWYGGAPFKLPVAEPVVARIRADYEHEQLLPWFAGVPVGTEAFCQALFEAGVQNLELYDAVLRSGDGKVEHRGYKAVNVIGLVRAADLSRTEFSPLASSPLIDAHIDRLAIDPAKARGVLMFRLAEYVGAVVIHERVKTVLEARKFPFLEFVDPSEFVS